MVVTQAVFVNFEGKSEDTKTKSTELAHGDKYRWKLCMRERIESMGWDEESSKMAR